MLLRETLGHLIYMPVEQEGTAHTLRFSKNSTILAAENAFPDLQEKLTIRSYDCQVKIVERE